MTTKMKQHPATIPAAQLPIYRRAVERYPHLSSIRDAMHFCQALARLAAVETIPARDYYSIASVAQGGPWLTL